jgi:hypothetical protein
MPLGTNSAEKYTAISAYTVQSNHPTVLPAEERQ